MIVLATDVPVSDRQLTGSPRGAEVGWRIGSTFQNGSGDFAVAFSTANRVPHKDPSPFVAGKWLRDDSQELGRIFAASVEATEEAILNSLFAAETMEGRDGNTRMALPVSMVLDIIKGWNA